LLTLPEPASRDRVIPATHTPWDRRQRVRAFWVTLSSDNQQASVTCLCFVLWLCRVGSREPSSSLEPGGASRSLSDSLRPQTPALQGGEGAHSWRLCCPSALLLALRLAPCSSHSPLGESHISTTAVHCCPLQVCHPESLFPCCLLLLSAACLHTPGMAHVDGPHWGRLGGLKPQAPLPHTPAAQGCKLRAPAYKAPRLGQREQSSRTGCMWQFHQHMACLGHCVSLHAWRASLAETTLRQPEGALPFFAHTAWDWTWFGDRPR
jgi:hypothetical protein